MQKAFQEIFAGYQRKRGGYRIWLPSKNKVIITKDVIFKAETTLGVSRKVSDAIHEESLGIQLLLNNVTQNHMVM